MNISMLEFYSLAVVAENKSLKSKVIEAVPIEISGFVDGELTGKADEMTAKATDATGAAYETTVKSTASVPATWLPFGGSNRLTAPDVRRGETVMLLRYANSQQLFWVTMMDGLALRRLETITFAISATQETDAVIDSTNTYFFHMSSHEKLLAIHTSQKDGEPFGYDIQLNTKDGNFQITDTDGNTVQLDSKERRIELQNADGSHYDMHGKNLTVTIPETTTFKTKDLVFESETTVHKAASSITTETGTITTNADTQTITATTLHKGNVTIAGNISGIAGSAGAGEGSFAGSIRTDQNLAAGGDVNVDGTMHAKKVISDQNIDAPNV